MSPNFQGVVAQFSRLFVEMSPNFQGIFDNPLKIPKGILKTSDIGGVRLTLPPPLGVRYPVFLLVLNHPKI